MDAVLFLNFFSGALRALTSAIIGLVIAYLVKFYYTDVKSYPRGPTPLPLIGNLLEFARKGERPPHRVLLDLKDKYGSVFTFWMGRDPQIVVCDSKLAKEALVSYHFGGRPAFQTLHAVFFPEGSTDIVFADWGREWEVLRRVSHSAIRKFAVNENLPIFVHKSLQTLFIEIKKKQGDEPFDTEEYFTFLMLSLLTTINFGYYLTMDHPDFIEQSEAVKSQSETNNKMILIDMVPALRHFWSKEWNDIIKSNRKQTSYIERKFKEHELTYDEENIRDFTDAMIFAKREAEAENSPDLVHLKQMNVIMAIVDIYTAGSETTKITLQWVILFMSVYQKHQMALREEIAAVLGDREYPVADDRTKCHKLQAFISEAMRIRPIVPTNVPHKAIMDTELGGHKIKKNTAMIIPIEVYQMDEEIWGDPEVFRPERFLTEDGKYNPKPNSYFLPFSAGRRSCLGEKLAIANSFLIVAGLLNQTKGKMFTVAGNIKDVDLSFDPNRDINGRPRPHKIKLVDATSPSP